MQLGGLTQTERCGNNNIDVYSPQKPHSSFDWKFNCFSDSLTERDWLDLASFSFDLLLSKNTKESV